MHYQGSYHSGQLELKPVGGSWEIVQGHALQRPHLRGGAGIVIHQFPSVTGRELSYRYFLAFLAYFEHW